jgi:hypothetical protein
VLSDLTGFRENRYEQHATGGYNIMLYYNSTITNTKMAAVWTLELRTTLSHSVEYSSFVYVYLWKIWQVFMLFSAEGSNMATIQNIYVSWSVSQARYQHEAGNKALHPGYSMLVSCLDYSLSLKLAVIHSAETQVYLMPKDWTLHSHRCEKRKSNTNITSLPSKIVLFVVYLTMLSISRLQSVGEMVSDNIIYKK